MKLICLFVFALFSLAQASPIPGAAVATVTKTYTLPDGTVVHEVVKHEDGKTLVIRRFSKAQIVNVNQQLEALPNVKITQSAAGASNILSIPANELYQFLISNGFQFPQPANDAFFGQNSNKQVSIYLTQLYKLLANVDQLKSISALEALNVMKTKPTQMVKAPPSVHAGKPGCKTGLIAGAANGISQAASGVLGTVAGIFGSGALGDVAQGASALVSHVVGGANAAIQDAACGLENIANTAANAIDTGNPIDIVEGAGDMVGEAVSGVASIATDAVGHVASGIADTAGDLLSGITNLL